MKNKKKRKEGFPLILVLLLMVLAFAISALSPSRPPATLANASNGRSEQVNLEVADTPLSRMRGLMFRDKIVPILFKFDSSGKWAIHSNFVKAEFDAVYLSSDGTVVEMFRRIPPNTQLVSPKKDAKYLLELPVELTDSLGIKVGSKIEWKMEGRTV